MIAGRSRNARDIPLLRSNGQMSYLHLPRNFASIISGVWRSGRGCATDEAG